MGEVDDVQHAEDEGEAQGHQAVNATDEQAGDQGLAQHDPVALPPGADGRRVAQEPQQEKQGGKGHQQLTAMNFE